MPPPVYGHGCHIGRYIEIEHKVVFFIIEKLEEDIFVILLFFMDLFTIFELITLITILSVNYGNHIILMTLVEAFR